MHEWSAMTRTLSLLICLLLLAGLNPFFGVDFAAAQTNSPAQATSSETDSETERKLGVIELFTLSNTLPRKLIDLQGSIEDMESASALLKKLPELEEIVEEMEWQVNIAVTTPDIGYHKLALLDSNIEKLKTRIDLLNRRVVTNVTFLQQRYMVWLNHEKEIEASVFSEMAEDGGPEISETAASVNETVVIAKNLIEETLATNLRAGKQISDLATGVYGLSRTVVDLIEDTSALKVGQTSPSMLSPDFYKPLNRRVFSESWENVRLFVLYQLSYVKERLGLVLLGGITIALLTYLIWASRKLTYVSKRWSFFAHRPFATALFIFFLSAVIFSLLALSFVLPPDWDALVQLPLLLAVGYLSRQISIEPWQSNLIRWLIIFLAVSHLLNIINIPHAVFYLFVFYSALAVFVVFFFLFLKRARTRKQRTVTWAILFWGLFPLVILFAGAAGYDQFAVLLFGRVLTLVASTLAIWLMLQITAGLLEVGLLYFPMQIVRNNAETIVKQLFPLLVIVYGVFWLANTMMHIWLYPTLKASFEAISSSQMDISGLVITPGSILTIIFVVYATILCSRAIRAFLMQEVLPHYDAEKGVQLSIARLVHYAILTIGFLVLLRMLGFGLNQITILGGALGVGIGFGLQAIVNNFVSGLILLFERPLKVGDMIELGDDLGEVKELGLRATTVQTFDNAEIVIPNSELITGSVTNWTLAGKQARLRVPVGVAYGSDIEQVLKILLTCANEHPMVLSTPKPKALFLAFGASSLDFELRVWVLDVNDRLEVLSGLNQEIEYEFSDAGIEIPFPQTDLHLRSVDEQVVEGLKGKEQKGVEGTVSPS